jgi:hypothetical protein
MGTAALVPKSIEAIYTDFKGRREGLLNAVTLGEHERHFDCQFFN